MITTVPSASARSRALFMAEIIVGEIYQIRKGEVLINHNRNELILPKNRFP